MKIPKIMEVRREQIKIGDVICDSNGETMYLVIDTGRTFLHGHRCIKCMYTNEYDKPLTKWCIQDLSPKKKIIRLVEAQKSTKKS